VGIDNAVESNGQWQQEPWASSSENDAMGSVREIWDKNNNRVVRSREACDTMGSVLEDLEPKRKSIGAVEFRKKGNDGRQLWQ
jgi:hypothetical protein